MDSLPVSLTAEVVADEFLTKGLHTNTSSFPIHIQEPVETRLSQQPQHEVLQLRISACIFQVRAAHPMGVHCVLISFLSVLFSALLKSSGNGSYAEIWSALCQGYDEGTNPDLQEISGAVVPRFTEAGTLPPIPTPALLLLVVSDHAEPNYWVSRGPLVKHIHFLSSKGAISIDSPPALSEGALMPLW